jgi:TRAP-type C4-dicarboxylate transport system substrate-binding protein
MRRPICLALVLAAAALAGCGGGTKAGGGSDPPLTLRLGTHDLQGGTPGAGQLEEYARRVAELSEGRLRIQPAWRAAGDGPDWDQRVARLVVGGQLDMGLIQSRAWDTEGVDSLRALNAPFLITSDALLAEVVSAPIASDMLSGLEKAGVVGLALFPEGLRHPFGFKTPLLGPGDYTGKAIRAPTSDTVAAVFAALGATVDDDPPSPHDQAGMESSYLVDTRGTAAGNVALYPKANTLVANDDVWAGLDDRQREILEQAASQTRDWAIETLPSDAQAAKTYCDQGGAVVLASSADVAALEKATATVYAGLERNSQTKGFIEQIRALGSEAAASAAPAAAPCGGSEPEAAGADADQMEDTGGVTAIDGAYRAELTDGELLARGLSPEDAYNNAGLLRLTFDRGALTISEENDEWDDCHAVYSVSGRRLSIRVTGPGCRREDEATTFRWTLDGGALRLVVTGPHAKDRFTRVWWAGEPWMKLE